MENPTSTTNHMSNKNSLKVALSALAVFSLFFFSYITFSTYKPKALTEVREVKGYSTSSESVFDVPTPRYAKSLGYDQTLNSKKFTFQTDKSPEEIRSFYNTILLEDGWKLEKEGSVDGFFTGEYKKDDYLITVWASFDLDTKLTFSSVEILELE